MEERLATDSSVAFSLTDSPHFRKHFLMHSLLGFGGKRELQIDGCLIFKKEKACGLAVSIYAFPLALADARDLKCYFNMPLVLRRTRRQHWHTQSHWLIVCANVRWLVQSSTDCVSAGFHVVHPIFCKTGF